jgi:hypothetical protein
VLTMATLRPKREGRRERRAGGGERGIGRVVVEVGTGEGRKKGG